MTEQNNPIEVGSKVSGGGRVGICRRCELPFVFYPRRDVPTPAHCPICLDKMQERPSVVVERRCIKEYDVYIESLPEGWRQFHSGQDGDFACYKIDVSGARYGARWNGRIVIYANREWEKGDVVRVRVMEAVHQVRKVVADGSGKEYDVIQEEVRPYIFLDNGKHKCPDYRLIFVEASTKTTLKGYGRQIHNHLFGAPIWERRISGGVRSWRIHTEASLAIVSDDHPLDVSSGESDFGE